MSDVGPAGPAIVDAGFWRDRRVLLTGHTGFKGSWLALWLERLGANVTGLALGVPTDPSLYELARVGEGLSTIVCSICVATITGFPASWH